MPDATVVEATPTIRTITAPCDGSVDALTLAREHFGTAVRVLPPGWRRPDQVLLGHIRLRASDRPLDVVRDERV